MLHGMIMNDPRRAQLIKRVFDYDNHYLMATDNDKVGGILPLIQLKSLLLGDFMVSMSYFNYGSIVTESDAIAMSLIDAAHELSDELHAHISKCVLVTGGNDNSTSMLNKLFTALPVRKSFKIMLHSRFY